METGEPELKIVTNPFRGGSEPLHPEAPYPSVAAQRVADLLGQCPVHMETPLCAAPDLAALNALYDQADFGQGLRRQADRIAEHF